MERQRLLAFLRVVAQFISARCRDAGSPSDDLANLPWERASLAGLRMTVRDFVEWCVDISGDQLIALDTQLEAGGAPTLTAMRQAGYRNALAVLARGAIRNEGEWHLLNGLLSHIADQTLTPTERALAERLVRDYEARVAARRGGG